MSESGGEKTEQPTQRKLEESINRGQHARSAELQTVAVLVGGMAALAFTGGDIWRNFTRALTMTLGHLHDIPLGFDNLQAYAVSSALLVVQCVGPVVLMVIIASLVVGGAQSRFQTASEALTPDWNRVNPINGLKKVFTLQNGVPTLIACVKLVIIVAVAWHQVKEIFTDPIFYSTVSIDRIGKFMADTAYGVVIRLMGALAAIAAVDYGYQWWKHHKDMMMTKEEIKEETKSTEGNPQMKSAQRRRARRFSMPKMLMEVAKADVVVTNPTHLAVALRYDRKNMKAPRIVAKGSRLNALKIREMAARHQVPITENKPLARMLFKYGKVGGEIPAQLYLAVAEVLAWVYRTNRYRYYTEQNQLK